MKTDLMENIDNPKPCPRCGNGDVHARLLDTDEFGYIACTHHYVNWDVNLMLK